MRFISKNWFETTVRYERQTEDGLKKVSELYVVDAINFGETEETITQELAPFVSGEFNVKGITPATYKEIIFSDDANDDKWYKAKLTFITLDDVTSKEKKTNVYYLVQAKTFNGAVTNIEEAMKGSLGEYVIANISETKILDVFEHEATKSDKTDDRPEYEEQDKKQEDK